MPRLRVKAERTDPRSRPETCRTCFNVMPCAGWDVMEITRYVEDRYVQDESKGASRQTPAKHEVALPAKNLRERLSQAVLRRCICAGVPACAAGLKRVRL